MTLYKSKRAERRALGLCIRCDTKSKSYYCPVHAAEHRKHQNGRNVKRKARDKKVRAAIEKAQIELALLDARLSEKH